MPDHSNRLACALWAIVFRFLRPKIALRAHRRISNIYIIRNGIMKWNKKKRKKKYYKRMGLWHADLLVTKSSVKSDAILHSFSANRLIKFKKLIIFPSGSSPRGLMWINREPFKSPGVFFFWQPGTAWSCIDFVVHKSAKVFRPKIIIIKINVHGQVYVKWNV